MLFDYSVVLIAAKMTMARKGRLKMPLLKCQFYIIVRYRRVIFIVESLKSSINVPI